MTLLNRLVFISILLTGQKINYKLTKGKKLNRYESRHCKRKALQNIVKQIRCNLIQILIIIKYIVKNVKRDFINHLNYGIPNIQNIYLYDRYLPKPRGGLLLNHKKTKPTCLGGFRVVPPGIEPGTQGFSVLCSTN